MSEWKCKKLKEIISFQRKGITPAYAKKGKGTVLVLNQKCNRDYSINTEEAQYNDIAKKKVSLDLLLQPGDVLINSTGKGTLGRVAQYRGSDYPATVDSHMLIIRPTEEIDAIFFGYAIKQFQSILMTKGIGSSGQEELDKLSLNEIKISYPSDLKLQKKVAQILSSLDKKIELNRRLNDNLEAMAQALYDYWFVQFDFPDEKGMPYKSSGGKMVWNEQLKREIPEGWEVKQIREVADTCLGGTPVTNIREYWDGGNIPWISSGDLTSNPLLQVSDYITQKGLNNSAAKLMPKGTVVVSLVRYIRPSILGIDAAGNQSVVGIFANKILPTCFLYPYVKSEVPRLMGLRTGAQQPHINKEVIDSSFIVLPDNVSIMGQYQNKALGIYEKLLCVAKERESLTKQRDFLLPLLMNGQVQVRPLNYRLADD